MESSAPSYLRTHPLTVERIAELENRVEKLPIRRVTDSFDFQLVKAKLRATSGSPKEAVRYFDLDQTDTQLARPARTYGLAIVAMRSRDFAGAQRGVDDLRKSGIQHPMIEALAANIKTQQAD
jgi:predicted Zn-dependent protease